MKTERKSVLVKKLRAARRWFARERLKAVKRSFGRTIDLKDIQEGNTITIDGRSFYILFVPDGDPHKHVLNVSKAQCVSRDMLLDHAIEVVESPDKHLCKSDLFVCMHPHLLCLGTTGRPISACAAPLLKTSVDYNALIHCRPSHARFSEPGSFLYYWKNLKKKPD
jgi:hypothetical protein